MRVRVERRTRYALVDVDLWNCPFDLNDAGIEQCRAIVEGAARRTPKGLARGFAGASRTGAAVTRCLNNEADEIAARLLAVICNPRHQQPIRPWSAAA